MKLLKLSFLVFISVFLLFSVLSAQESCPSKINMTQISRIQITEMTPSKVTILMTVRLANENQNAISLRNSSFRIYAKTQNEQNFVYIGPSSNEELTIQGRKFINVDFTTYLEGTQNEINKKMVYLFNMLGNPRLEKNFRINGKSDVWYQRGRGFFTNQNSKGIEYELFYTPKVQKSVLFE